MQNGCKINQECVITRKGTRGNEGYFHKNLVWRYLQVVSDQCQGIIHVTFTGAEYLHTQLPENEMLCENTHYVFTFGEKSKQIWQL